MSNLNGKNRYDAKSKSYLPSNFDVYISVSSKYTTQIKNYKIYSLI